MIVEPQPTRQAQSQRRKTKTASQSKNVVEDRNARCDQESDDCETDRAAHPGSPVDDAVLLKVLGVSQYADKDVLGSNVDVQRSTDTESDKSDTERNFLHDRPTAS